MNQIRNETDETSNKEQPNALSVNTLQNLLTQMDRSNQK